MPKIIYYRQKCIGCNGCIEAAPNHWRISRTDGRSVLLGSQDKKGIYQKIIPHSEVEDNERAAANCPAKVIQVRG